MFSRSGIRIPANVFRRRKRRGHVHAHFVLRYKDSGECSPQGQTLCLPRIRAETSSAPMGVYSFCHFIYLPIVISCACSLSFRLLLIVILRRSRRIYSCTCSLSFRPLLIVILRRSRRIYSCTCSLSFRVPTHCHSEAKPKNLIHVSPNSVNLPITAVNNCRAGALLPP